MGPDRIDTTFVIDRLLPALVGIMCLVVVPTTAATLDGGLVDSLGQDTDIILEPYDGPNGEQYVEIQDESEELTINITEHGVNTDAITTIDDLFNVTNVGDGPREVWVTDSVSNESVIRVYTDGGETYIDANESRVTLAPNETVTAGIRIDTYDGAINPARTLRFTIIVHVRFLEDTDGDGIPDRDDACPNRPEDFDGVEDEDGCPETNSYSGNGTTVTFSEPIPTRAADRASVDRRDLIPTAITADIVDPTPSNRSELVRQRLDADLYADVGTETTLDGVVTLDSGLDGIDDRRMIKHVAIRTPASVTERPSSIAMTVPRRLLGTDDAADLRIATRSADGWRLLDTSVQSTTPGSVTVAAPIQSRSGQYAVLVPNSVTRTWTIEGEVAPRTGNPLQYAFPSEGTYDVSLTATDETGRTATASTRVFADESPEVSVDVVSSSNAQRTATLDAAVTNALPSATVTWRFPDGTTATGERATHQFQSSQPTVTVTVTDAFGETTVSRTLDFGASGGGGGGGSGGDGGGSASGGGDDTSSDDGGTTTVSEGGVTVTIPTDGSDTQGGISVQELNVVGPDSENRTGPRAVIAPNRSETDLALEGSISTNGSGLSGRISAANAAETLDASIRRQIESNPVLDAAVRRSSPEEVQRLLQQQNIDLLTETERETELIGSHSLFATKESIADDKRMVRHVSVSVPPEMRNRSSTIELTVPASRLGNSSADDLQIAHNTEEGWQLLQTRVVGRENGTILLRATTPGFSRFAVFAQNSVTFEWEVETFDEPFEGQSINPTFADPGVYGVTLTVSDAFGLTDRTDYRILANDPPDITVSQRSIDQQNRTVTLEAAVDNEVGNVTVTWVFPDGSTATGRQVTHAFSGENTTVEVYAADEYGAIGKADTTVAFGQSLISFESGIPIELRYVLGSWVVGLVVVLFRWRLAHLVGGVFISHAPDIVAVENPTADAGGDRVSVEYLRIDDAFGDLTEITLRVVTDGGDDRGQTTIECDRTERYEREDQVVWTEPLDGDRETYVLRVEATDDDGSTATAQRRIAVGQRQRL